MTSSIYGEQRAYIPAKALLFGEYGVLSGGPAVALTFWKYYFCIDIVVSHKGINTAPSCEVYSSAIEAASCRVPLVFSSDLPHHEKFFSGILQPYAEFLQKYHTKISIVNSFSSDLGFGSSSAIIAGVHRLLFNIFYPNENFSTHAVFWENLFISLVNTQKKGSGYDISLQALQGTLNPLEFIKNKSEFFIYHMPTKNNPIPNIIPFVIENTNKLGMFVESGVYSSTSAALQKNNSENIINRHKNIACDFIANPKIDTIPNLMQRSRAAAREQGILPPENATNTAFSALCNSLDVHNLAWKSMGSGLGDCLWVWANPLELPLSLHPIKQIPWLQSIALNFQQEDN